jgi:hypothetical protein
MNPMKDSPGWREDGSEARTSTVTSAVTPLRYAAMLAALSAAGTSPALGAERACVPPPVETDSRVRAVWADLPDRIQDALEGRGDIDACAQVRIRLDQATFVLEVVLPDGRTTSRSVARREDLLPTLEALLLLPLPASPQPEGQPDGETEASTPAAIPARRAELRPRADARAEDRSPVLSATPEPAAPRPRGWLRLEFSLAAGVRVGDGQAGVGFGALTFFDLRGWLVGFEGATQQYTATDGVPGAAVLELAILAGRRFRLGDSTLDLTAGPALAMHGLENRVSVTMQSGSSGSTPVPPPAVDDGPLMRLVGGARWTFRARSVLRLFAGIEGELALERSATILAPVERLPAWTVGLVLGTTVGTP